MKKYYYKNQLHASIMAEQFNFHYERDKYYSWESKELKHNIVVVLAYDITESDKCNLKTTKYYIHPDCHEMLKPQVGDLLKTVYAHHDEYWMYREERQLLTRYNKAEIIQLYA